MCHSNSTELFTERSLAWLATNLLKVEREVPDQVTLFVVGRLHAFLDDRGLQSGPSSFR